MELAKVEDVIMLLTEHGIPEVVLTTFAGKYFIIWTMHASFFAIDNYIDGTALVSLQKDFEEIKSLVPQSGLRMRIKAIINSAYESENVLISMVC